jgi:hypothetical protein
MNVELAVKDAAHRLSRVLLGRHRVALFRWVRAQRDLYYLRRADVAVIYFAKSGSTWLRALLSRLFQVKYQLPEQAIIERDNLHKLNSAVPVFLFTHGHYIQDFKPLSRHYSPYADKKLIFLVRHPADVAVSLYFNTRYRTNPLRKDIKRLPDDLSQTSIYDFVSNPTWGMPAIIDYFNRWAEAFHAQPRYLLIRYEDLRADSAAQLRRIADFIGEQFSDAAYAEAVQFASFQNLQDKERRNFFDNRRLQARDQANPDSFKVRKGKVGGYREHFTESELAALDGMINTRLSPIFGYSRSPV